MNLKKRVTRTFIALPGGWICLKTMDLKKRAARTFTALPGGWMSIKTFGHGGRLVNERIVPLEEGRQIQQGYRPGEPPTTGPYRRVD